MGAIWRDHGLPSFMGVGPSFSFHDLGQVEAPAPITYEAARQSMIKLEKQLGPDFYKHNAKLSYEFYLAKRPWWLI